MMAVLWLITSLASAQETFVVRAGDTIESIANVRGLTGQEADIRMWSHLGPDDQPRAGDVLYLTAPSDENAPAQILLSHGTGTALLPDGRTIAVTSSLDVPTGTTVCTEMDSFLTLRLATDPANRAHDDVSLLPETCARIDATWTKDGRRSSLIYVPEGAVSVRDSEGNGEVSVRTDSGMSTGQGSGYRVANEDGAQRTEALTGAVSVMGDGTEVSLPAGYGSRVREGEAPSEPVALPPAGTPLSPAERSVLLRPDFTWTETDRALGYWIVVSTTPDFSNVVIRESTVLPAWKPQVLLLPYRVTGWWWRVTSFDRTGYESLPSEARELVIPGQIGP